MALDAGDLDRRIRLERLAAVADDWGTDDPAGWAPLAERWAKVAYGNFFGAGDEKREGAQVQAVVNASVTLRRDRLTLGLTAKDRFRFDPGGSPGATSPIWNIVSVNPSGADAIVITAILAGNQPDLGD